MHLKKACYCTEKKYQGDNIYEKEYPPQKNSKIGKNEWQKKYYKIFWGYIIFFKENPTKKFRNWQKFQKKKKLLAEARLITFNF